MELTIVIPVYNREKFLERTVQSIFDSRVAMRSLYLVDNNSTDGSLALCKKLSEAYPCIEVFTAEKQGASVARNVGLDKCETEWVYFFDSDDIFTGLPKVENESDYDVISFPTRKVTEDDKEVVRWFPQNAQIENQILGGFLSTQSGIYRTAWLREKELRWNEELIMWDDWEFATRVLMNNPRILLLRKAVCHRILVHADSISGPSFKHNVAGKFRAIEKVYDYVSRVLAERIFGICKKLGVEYEAASEECQKYIMEEAESEDIQAVLFSLYLHCEITAGHVLHETGSLSSKCEDLRGCYPIDKTSFNNAFNVDKEEHKLKATILKYLTGLGMRGTYRIAIAYVSSLRANLKKNTTKRKK
jgi:glycosyltransferase involved in cell wall biosynthesis